MRSQSSVLAHSTKTLNSLTISNNKGHHRPTTPVAPHHSAQKKQSIQMTTGGGINNGNNNNSTSGTTTAQQSPSALSPCNTIPSTSSIHTLSKASTISSTIRHSNVSLSSNNNNSTTAINNNKLSTNNNNNNSEGSSNPNSNKLQTLEQRKLELEKLLNEKNWLLQQIHKQEAQILNGNYENFNLFESGKGSGNIVSSTGGTTTTLSGTTNSILRRKGSSSLKLPKTNVHFNGKNNRFTLSKSEYDLAQENKLNIQETITNPNVLSIKKRQGQPMKTNSFHDSTSVSALSLTKSPSFEYNESSPQSGGSSVVVGSGGGSSNHGIKYSIVRPHHSSNENLSNILGITQCDKYYLSPTSQMYADGTGFIKASQNIKQCLSPSPMHKMLSLNDTEIHRKQQQDQQQQQQHHQQQQHPQHQMQMANSHNLVQHNGSQPHLEQYESVDALSLSPSNSFEKPQHFSGQHSNLWRALSNNDRSAWCDNSYIELDRESVVNQYHSLNPLAKKILPTTSLSGSSMQHLPESPSLGNFYPIGGIIMGSYPNTIEKSCDEVSISSLNSDTTKKPKNKQWMESSLDGPIIRPNILQSTPSVTDTIALCPALSPTLSQNPQYAYYNVQRQATVANTMTPSGKLTPSPAKSSAVVGAGSSVPVVNSRPPTRTLTHHAHPHHKQSYRERTKLSSQSMSNGSYRTPKTKIDDENSHLSHSTSYLNVDPYHHHHFPQQQLTHQTYHHNHYHLDILNNTSGNVMLPPLQQQQQQQQQKQLQQLHQQTSPKSSPSSTSSQQQPPPLPKFSPTIQQPQLSSNSVNDDFVGTIRYATSVATQPSRLCSLSQTITKNTIMQQKPTPPNSLPINTVQQMSPQSTTSPDIRIESPKNITVVQQATFLPYKEVTKPFEMSDFYKYSTKFRQKEANTATMSKNST